MDNLIFLKLGGSLITDKERPRTPRVEVLDSLCRQIAEVRVYDPNLLLLLGHGSGSFGHVAAKEYATRAGIPPLAPPSGGSTDSLSPRSKDFSLYWRGFTEVWHEANELNKIVMDALRGAKIPAIAFSPLSSVVAKDGEISEWNLSPIMQALANGIVPVVYGDVVIDEVRGGTILSTEDLFMHLARKLHPQRVLLAGVEDAIYADFPARKQRVTRVSPVSYQKIRASIGKSHATDVTGGMSSKVEQMLALVEFLPALSVQIFSGGEEGNLKDVLLGKIIGTLIEMD